MSEFELFMRLATEMLAIWVAGFGAMGATISYYFGDADIGHLCVGMTLIGAMILCML